jgi:mannosyltransferase OCH1-like enzyme
MNINLILIFIIFIILIISLIIINYDNTDNFASNIDNMITLSNIPKNIFQTHKSMEYIEGKKDILRAVNSWRKYDGEFNYRFYNDKQAEDFIKDNFDNDTYTAYMKLPMAVMKADLWRYCIIYTYGGIYADTDTILKANPNILLKDSLLVIVPENNTNLCQWVFAAPKKSEILENIIKLSVKKILEKDEIKGEHIIHELTGPTLFTQGIEKYLENNNKQNFIKKFDYTYYKNSILYVFHPKRFHKKTVVHLFSGQDDDGWTIERDKKLK